MEVWKQSNHDKSSMSTWRATGRTETIHLPLRSSYLISTNFLWKREGWEETAEFNFPCLNTWFKVEVLRSIARAADEPLPNYTGENATDENDLFGPPVSGSPETQDYMSPAVERRVFSPMGTAVMPMRFIPYDGPSPNPYSNPETATAEIRRPRIERSRSRSRDRRAGEPETSYVSEVLMRDKVSRSRPVNNPSPDV